MPSSSRCRAIVALCAALALVAGGCSGGTLGSGVAARVLTGSVQIETAQGWSPVVAGDDIAAGARVRTGDEDARLRARDGELWLAPSSAATLTGDIAELDSGEILVRGNPGLEVRGPEVTLAGSGTYRLSLGAAPRVGSYEGSVEVRRPGEGRELVALREISLSVRRLPTTGQPLSYHHDDPWDRELLAQAVAFDEEVARLARGIDREYGQDSRDDEFYASFVAVPDSMVPVLASTARTLRPNASFGPPSDALLTLFVSQATAQTSGRDVADVLREVAALRIAGARWGLVAMELRITASDLAAAVDLAQERRIALEPAPPAPPPDSDDEGTPQPPPSPPPSPQPSPPGGPDDPDDPPEDDEPGVVERTVDDVLDSVRGAVGPPLRALP